jgi:transcriptional regulator with XRE-family HTH domain
MENARSLRGLLGYSQSYVAYELSISQSLYCKMENGQITPTIDLVERLCDLFQIGIEDFLKRNGKEIVILMLDNSHLKEQGLR